MRPVVDGRRRYPRSGLIEHDRGHARSTHDPSTQTIPDVAETPIPRHRCKIGEMLINKNDRTAPAACTRSAAARTHCASGAQQDRMCARPNTVTPAARRAKSASPRGFQPRVESALAAPKVARYRRRWREQSEPSLGRLGPDRAPRRIVTSRYAPGDSRLCPSD